MLPRQLSPNLGNDEIPLCEREGGLRRSGLVGFGPKTREYISSKLLDCSMVFEIFKGIFPIVAGEELIQNFGKGAC